MNKEELARNILFWTIPFVSLGLLLKLLFPEYPLSFTTSGAIVIFLWWNYE